MLTISGNGTVARRWPSFWGFHPLPASFKQGFTSETVENNTWVERMGAVQFLTRCKFGGRQSTGIVCLSNSKRIYRPVGRIKPEKDVFDVTFTKGNSKSVLDDEIQDEENVRLVPQQWQFFQDDLHRTKGQKKLALRLRAREEELRRAEELQLKRQQLEEAGKALKERRRQQWTVSNEDKDMEQHSVVETDAVSSDMFMTSNKDMEQHSVVEMDAVSSDMLMTSNVRRELEETTEARQASSKKEFDSELGHLFTEDEIGCLKRGAPELTKFYCEKWPPLHALVAAGQFFFLDEYLKSDLDLNFVDEDGYTPIHKAILGRKETAVSQLLRAGADPFILDKDGASFLHYSTQIGSLNLVRLFVKCRVDVNHPDKDGWTALHIAVLTAREDIVRHLLFSGADTHRKTKDGQAPFDLCLAIGKGHQTFAIAKNLKRHSKTQESPNMELDERSLGMEPEVEEDSTSEEGVVAS